MKVKSESEVTQSCRLLATPWTIQPMEFSGQNAGVGSLSLLQGIFPTQGLNPGLPNCRQILYQLSHKGSPRILEWVAFPFSSRSSLIQESNWGLLHCRQPLYHLSYQGSPRYDMYIYILYIHVRVCQVSSVVSNSVTLWTVARQAPFSTGLSRQEYWSGLPCPSPGDLPNPGIKPRISYVSCVERQVLYH